MTIPELNPLHDLNGIPTECADICREAMRLNKELARIVTDQHYFKVGGRAWIRFEKERVVKSAHLRKSMMACEECKSGLERGSVSVPFMGMTLSSDSSIDEFIELELLDSPLETTDISDFDKFAGEQADPKGCLGSVVILCVFTILSLVLLS